MECTIIFLGKFASLLFAKAITNCGGNVFTIVTDGTDYETTVKFILDTLEQNSKVSLYMGVYNDEELALGMLLYQVLTSISMHVDLKFFMQKGVDITLKVMLLNDYFTDSNIFDKDGIKILFNDKEFMSLLLNNRSSLLHVLFKEIGHTNKKKWIGKLISEYSAIIRKNMK